MQSYEWSVEHCKDKGLILQLYKSLVRPRLECCIQAWRPYLKKDISFFGNGTKTATKLISGLSEMGYEERLKILGLTTLETRRLRWDLIEVFKIIKGYEDIDQKMFLDMSQSIKSITVHSRIKFKFKFNPSSQMSADKISTDLRARAVSLRQLNYLFLWALIKFQIARRVLNGSRRHRLTVCTWCFTEVVREMAAKP